MAEETKSCCTGGSTGVLRHSEDVYFSAAQTVAVAACDVQMALRNRLIALDGGFFDMGARQSRFPEDLDSPRRKVRVSSFLMSPHAVTNADFAEFVAATGYKTVAEQEGWSYVFHLFLDPSKPYPDYAGSAPWWRRVYGACWHAPEGPQSNVGERQDHPATHIAWYDAYAYCQWAGLRLPSDAEWEFAARGGLAHKKFPWGNQLTPDGQFAMNTWQGSFPDVNTAEDGWPGTAPVGAYGPNGFGLYQMTGNVWEWVQDFYGTRSPEGRLPERDPKGPATGEARIQRGGSYLCHVSYCDRYHVHSRTRNDPVSTAGHSGFRVAADG